jgi:hypothetical protein
VLSEFAGRVFSTEMAWVKCDSKDCTGCARVHISPDGRSAQVARRRKVDARSGCIGWQWVTTAHALAELEPAQRRWRIRIDANNDGVPCYVGISGYSREDLCELYKLSTKRRRGAGGGGGGSGAGSKGDSKAATASAATLSKWGPKPFDPSQAAGVVAGGGLITTDHFGSIPHDFRHSMPGVECWFEPTAKGNDLRLRQRWFADAVPPQMHRSMSWWRHDPARGIVVERPPHAHAAPLPSPAVGAGGDGGGAGAGDSKVADEIKTGIDVPPARRRVVLCEIDRDFGVTTTFARLRPYAAMFGGAAVSFVPWEEDSAFDFSQCTYVRMRPVP